MLWCCCIYIIIIPTATEGTDFTDTSEEFTFPAGSPSGTLRCVDIPILRTAMDTENDRVFNVTLSTASVVTVTQSSASVRITETAAVVAETGGVSSGAERLDCTAVFMVILLACSLVLTAFLG